MNGNWYCSFCNDVVNLRKPVGRWDATRGVECPVCHHNAAEWVPRRETASCGVCRLIAVTFPGQLCPDCVAKGFLKVREAVK